MTQEKLEKAIQLKKQIDYLQQKIEAARICKCHWIEFAFGNGSENMNVCTDKNIINSVRDFIIKESELKLDSLKEEFNNL